MRLKMELPLRREGPQAFGFLFYFIIGTQSVIKLIRLIFSNNAEITPLHGQVARGADRKTVFFVILCDDIPGNKLPFLLSIWKLSMFIILITESNS
jgi:hypothetical protein